MLLRGTIKSKPRPKKNEQRQTNTKRDMCACYASNASTTIGQAVHPMVTTRTTTAAELLAMGSDAPYVLIQGELVRVSPSAFRSNLVLSTLHAEITLFVRAHRLGYVSVAEGGYLVETNPDTVIAPDIGFVRRTRMPRPIPERGYLPIRPDLVVEVRSPTDERGDIDRKQALYDRIQVPLVWWIDPHRETATIHIPGRSVQRLDRTGVLDGGNVLPGFTLALSNVFAEF